MVMTRDGAIEEALFGSRNVVRNDTLIERKDLTVIIDAPLGFVQTFFGPVRSGLSKPRFHHLWTLVLSFLLNVRRAKLTHLAGALPGHMHRTAHGVFLSRSDWAAAGLLDAEVHGLLRWRKPRRGEVIYLIIDDTRIAKQGKKMFGVSKIWDHKEQRFVRGHIVVTAAILFRGVTLPWRFDRWLPKRWAGLTRNQIAKQTDLSYSVVHGFMAGRDIQLSTASKIAAVVGIELTAQRKTKAR